MPGGIYLRQGDHLVEMVEQPYETEVEVKQYVDSAGEHQTLVPRLVGQTERARQAKGPASGEHWNRDRLLALADDQSPTAADIARRVLDWATQLRLRIWFGRGRQTGSFVAGPERGIGCYPFTLYTNGKIEVQFQPLSRRPPFDQREMREKLRARLEQIQGLSLPKDSLDRAPSFPLSALVQAGSLETFFEAFEWVFEEVRAAEASSSPAA
jgi:hypothetical protein